MKELNISVRIKDPESNTDVIETYYVTSEEIEQLACNKAREVWSSAKRIYSEGISSIHL